MESGNNNMPPLHITRLPDEYVDVISELKEAIPSDKPMRIVGAEKDLLTIVKEKLSAIPKYFQEKNIKRILNKIKPIKLIEQRDKLRGVIEKQEAVHLYLKNYIDSHKQVAETVDMANAQLRAENRVGRYEQPAYPWVGAMVEKVAEISHALESAKLSLFTMELIQELKEAHKPGAGELPVSRLEDLLKAIGCDPGRVDSNNPDPNLWEIPLESREILNKELVRHLHQLDGKMEEKNRVLESIKSRIGQARTMAQLNEIEADFAQYQQDYAKLAEQLPKREDFAVVKMEGKGASGETISAIGSFEEKSAQFQGLQTTQDRVAVGETIKARKTALQEVAKRIAESSPSPLMPAGSTIRGTQSASNLSVGEQVSEMKTELKEAVGKKKEALGKASKKLKGAVNKATEAFRKKIPGFQKVRKEEPPEEPLLGP